MKYYPHFLVFFLSATLGFSPAFGQLEIRNAVSSSSGNAHQLVDGIIATGWNSGEQGDTASLLLSDPRSIEAGYVQASDTTSSPFYQFLASENYRDWVLLDEGSAGTIEQMGEIQSFPAFTAQYLRLVSREPTPTTWELIAGSLSEVQQQYDFLQPVDWGDITDPVNILSLIDLAFDWQLDNPTSRQDGTGWVTGAFYSGVSGLYLMTDDEKYLNAILDIGNATNWTLRLRHNGKGHYHADDHALGQSWLELFLSEENPKPVWIADVQARLDRVMGNPLPGRSDMNWCDALYMSPPNYVRMAEISGNDAYRTFVDTQWWDVTDYLYDQEYHLFYRDSNYFNDREANGKPVFWSRGNGWVLGGLVRMLQYMPETWSTRGDYITLLEEMAAAVADIQGADGLWRTSLLYPERFNNEPETSGSAFFTYALAWGVNEGLLPVGTYGPIIEKAWAGLVSMLNRNGSIQYIQQVGAAPARNDGKYSDKDYGYGAFILAGTELMRFYAGQSLALTQPAYTRLANPPIDNPDAWTSVDDFESGFAWSVRKTLDQEAVLLEDPFDPNGSVVFSLNTGFLTDGYYRATLAIPPIPNGSTGTVYQRFAYDNIEIDVVTGVSDEPVVETYGDYETGVRIYFAENRLEARAGGRYERIADDFLQLGTWYETWTIIDNQTDTYSVYLRGGSNYPEITLLESGIPFRNGTSKAIVSFSLSYNSKYCEGTFYLDDIQVDNSGVNLSRPAGVRQTSYSPWAELPMRRPALAKDTPVGMLWDQDFPWIYHQEMGGYCYILPTSGEAGGYPAWSLKSNSWLWLSSAWSGWYFDYGTGLWYRW